MNKIHSVVIVDDHKFIREGLKALLNTSDDFKVIGEAGNGMDAIRCIKEKRPEMAMVDINMPHIGGLSVIKECTRSVPDVKILVLTMHSENGFAKKAFQNGAKGYCLKTASHRELLFAVRTVLSGKIYMSPEIINSIIEGFLDKNECLSLEALTRQELEVLKLVGGKCRIKDLADFFCSSIKPAIQYHAGNSPAQRI